MLLHSCRVRAYKLLSLFVEGVSEIVGSLISITRIGN